MKVIKNIQLCLVLACLIVGGKVTGQNMTSSPYSMFGLGVLTDGQYGQNAGMGGVSIGMRDGLFINSVNPAGLTGLDSLRLIADASAFAQQENYHSGGTSSDAFTGNFSSFSMGGRLMPHWYMAAGVYPYSTVGYYFRTKEPVEGTEGSYYYSTFEGSGGLSTASLSNAILIGRHLSLGVTMSYVFGNLKQVETQESMSVTQKMFANAFNARFGLQYSRPIAKETTLTFGLTYGYKQEIRLNNSTTVLSGSTSTERSEKEVTQYIPSYIGVGLALHRKHITYGADYTLRQYSALNSGDTRITFNDLHEVRAGLSYFPATYASDKFWKRIVYKAGASFSNSYLSVSGKGGYTWRVSGGLGFPVSNGRIFTALYYDRMQLSGNSLRSSTIGFSVSYTLNELFYKVKL